MMTEQQFDERLKEIESGYAGRRDGADAYRDQEVARLFVESGWTQASIARRMGRAQSLVAQRLLFGRFLAWFAIITDRDNSFSPPKPLTEWRFRDNWSRARPDPRLRRKDAEADRFA